MKPHTQRMLLSGLALLASAAMPACKTDSPPTREEIQAQTLLKDMPATRPWAAVNAAPGEIQDNWLATFNDPQLTLLVDEAIRNNPDLSVAAARIEQAAGYVEQAKAAMRPRVGVAGTGGIKAGGGSDVGSALQGIMIAISWEPDLWGRMRYAQYAVEASKASAESDLEFARQSLAASTAQGWFLATETLLQKRLAADMVRSADELVAIARRRFEVGAGLEQEVAVALANLGNFQDTEKRAALAHENALRALEALLGRFPAAELAARTELTPLPGAVPAGMPLDMLERRPDMIAAERRVAAAFNRVGEAKMAKLPRIVLSANGAYIDSNVLQLAPSFSNPTFGAGGNIVAPIYLGGALSAQVDIRTAEQKEAIANYGRMALRAIADVENALAAARNLNEREPLLRKIVADNQRALELAQVAYRVGQQDLRSVQQQQLNVHAAQSALLQVETSQLEQRAKLHLALGGSFEQPLPVPATQSQAATSSK
jgi:NodT family efflux transporter outer membrane factor (OMF) lipoprotein